MSFYLLRRGINLEKGHEEHGFGVAIKFLQLPVSALLQRKRHSDRPVQPCARHSGRRCSSSWRRCSSPPHLLQGYFNNRTGMALERRRLSPLAHAPRHTFWRHPQRFGFSKLSHVSPGEESCFHKQSHRSVGGPVLCVCCTVNDGLLLQSVRTSKQNYAVHNVLQKSDLVGALSHLRDVLGVSGNDSSCVCFEMCETGYCDGYESAALEASV